jgi:hypothetical protein
MVICAEGFATSAIYQRAFDVTYEISREQSTDKTSMQSECDWSCQLPFRCWYLTAICETACEITMVWLSS